MEINSAVKSADTVLLYLSRNKKWVVKVEPDKKIHTHLGFINLNSLIDKNYGSSITTNLGERLWVLKPTITDLILKAQRSTQIVYPKDIGLIVSITGISPGNIIVEAGTGSGALTTFMANLVRPDGHIYTYEIRPEFLKIAQKNIEKLGLSEFVTLKHADAKGGFFEKNVDVALIDVGDPWTLVRSSWEALKGGGRIAVISPTMNQVEKLVSEMINVGFIMIESMELLLRELQVKPNMTRPSMMMRGHTAYLTFARKILKDN